MQFMRPVLALFAAFVMFASMLSSASTRAPSEPPNSLKLSRPARPWEFLPVVGTRAALFGNEAGRVEAWVYPLKFLREFHLIFHEGDRVISEESLARIIGLAAARRVRIRLPYKATCRK